MNGAAGSAARHRRAELQEPPSTATSLHGRPSCPMMTPLAVRCAGGEDDERRGAQQWPLGAALRRNPAVGATRSGRGGAQHARTCGCGRTWTARRPRRRHTRAGRLGRMAGLPMRHAPARSAYLMAASACATRSAIASVAGATLASDALAGRRAVCRATPALQRRATASARESRVPQAIAASARRGAISMNWPLSGEPRLRSRGRWRAPFHRLQHVALPARDDGALVSSPGLDDRRDVPRPRQRRLV